MVNSSQPCSPTKRERRWPYEQYYLGESHDGQRHGTGENHWSGAESLESYKGNFCRDTMHGRGDYKWRYMDPDGAFNTYEGWFYLNSLHGYGVMSYANGKTFYGLYYKDVRWGPGIEQTPSLRANVGLWRGTQLARLCWQPYPTSVVPDFTKDLQGQNFLDPLRIVLTENVKLIGETNSALELLKNKGADPILAGQMWQKLYPKYCTDENSVLFHQNMFDKKYYEGNILTLQEGPATDSSIADNLTEPDSDRPSSYYAWNNGEMILHMMKHSYQHEAQRSKSELDLARVLCGPRAIFMPADKHEIDCRTLLMASYLGHTDIVAQLVNENDVYSDIADIRGNTALMYAVCGDNTEIMHFLIEAGASANSCNDSCCKPLGVALIRYLCCAKDISCHNMIQALVRPTAPADQSETKATQTEIGTTEWYMIRNLALADELKLVQLPTLPPALAKRYSVKSNFSVHKANVTQKPSATNLQKKIKFYSDDEEFSEDKRQFFIIRDEYQIRVGELLAKSSNVPTKCIFEAYDTSKEIDDESAGSKLTKTNIPKKIKSKSKEPLKSQLVWENHDQEVVSSDSYENHKVNILSKMHMTILQLLADGADPALVKCPQPAIVLAYQSGCPELVKNVVFYGADVNEKFPDMGADTNHRLESSDSIKAKSDRQSLPPPRYTEQSIPSLSEAFLGPTLLHVILTKRISFEFEVDICRDMLNLLLQYNCDPFARYKGHSAIELALYKNIDFLLVFIKCPTTDLNKVINAKKHTILVKFFTRDFFQTTVGMDRFPILTNLLLYGADPLIECYDKGCSYGNVFEFAKKTLLEIAPPPRPKVLQEEASKRKIGSAPKGRDVKANAKKEIKPPRNAVVQPLPKRAEETDYSEALELLTECARMLHVRWLQGKLIRDLIDVIYKFKHRPWNTIIREHKDGWKIGMWLNTLRCLEIWDILKTSKKKKYKDETILKKLVSIVQFYQKRVKANLPVENAVKATEWNTIEADVGLLIREHNITSSLAEEAEAWKKHYVKPELGVNEDYKFQVCFECAIRLKETCLLCEYCQLVSFCDLECMEKNMARTTSHPCTDKLKDKYFLAGEDQDADAVLLS